MSWVGSLHAVHEGGQNLQEITSDKIGTIPRTRTRKDMQTGSERRGTEGLQGTSTPKGTIRRTGPRSWEHRDRDVVMVSLVGRRVSEGQPESTGSYTRLRRRP